MPKEADFTHRNESFICESCGRQVPPRKKSCRNHCPFCLSSKHVDINPGDRANSCGGLMKAIDYDLNSKKGLVLIFECSLCGFRGTNISAYEDEIEPDDYDLILKLKRS